METVLFKDKKTSHRVIIGGMRRVVHARYDHEGNFVRFVVLLTKHELDCLRKSYLPARVDIKEEWIEVFEDNFTDSW